MSKQVGISVDTSDGKVLVSFESPMQYLVFTPQQAVEYAEAILNKAISLADSQSGRLILPHNVVNLRGQ